MWEEQAESQGGQSLGGKSLGGKSLGGKSLGFSGQQRRAKTRAPLSDSARKELNSKAADGGYAKAMAAGVRFLASRDFSILELTGKLSRRFSDDAVGEVIAELVAQGLLDNQRYGEAFCRSRVERGYGPIYIARELEQNGLDADLVDDLLEPYQEQWFDRALAQATKAHRPIAPTIQAGADASVDEADFDSDANQYGDRSSSSERWHALQKARGRLARMLARRGFSGGLSSKVIEKVLNNAEAESSPDFD